MSERIEVWNCPHGISNVDSAGCYNCIVERVRDLLARMEREKSEAVAEILRDVMQMTEDPKTHYWANRRLREIEGEAEKAPGGKSTNDPT